MCHSGGSAEQWQSLVIEYVTDKLEALEFCDKLDVGHNTLPKWCTYFWGSSDSEAVGFVEFSARSSYHDDRLTQSDSTRFQVSLDLRGSILLEIDRHRTFRYYRLVPMYFCVPKLDMHLGSNGLWEHH